LDDFEYVGDSKNEALADKPLAATSVDVPPLEVEVDNEGQLSCWGLELLSLKTSRSDVVIRISSTGRNREGEWVVEAKSHESMVATVDDCRKARRCWRWVKGGRSSRTVLVVSQKSGTKSTH